MSYSPFTATRGQEITNNDHVADKHKHAGLKGLRGSWKKVPGHAGPFVAGVLEDISKYNEDPDEEVVLVHKEVKDVVEEDDEAVAIMSGNEAVTLPQMDGGVQEDTATTETVPRTDEKARNEKVKVKDPSKKGWKKGRTKVKGKRGRLSPTSSPSPTVNGNTFPSLTTSSILHGDHEYSSTPTSPFASIANTTEESTTPAPTADEIFTWSEETSTTLKVATTTCPPHYSTSANYTIGDTIEANLRIYQCKSDPILCNIAYMDNSWSDAEKKLWADAWRRVGECEQEVLVGEEGVVTTEAPIVITEDATATTSTVTATEAATTTTTTNTVTSTAEAPIPPEITQSQPCPTDYDTTKTSYLSGDYATVHYVAGDDDAAHSSIFKCSEEVGYDKYCNIAVWHVSLLDENENAYVMWAHAWEDVGPCLPTQEELMEAAAAADDSDS